MKFKLLFVILLIGQWLSAQIFSELTTTNPLEKFEYSSITFADIDNDGDQDFLISGDNVLGNSTSVLYKNEGLGNFIEVENTPFIGTKFGDIAFADVDGDNDPDVLIAGYEPKLYLNDGMGNFTEMENTSIEDVNLGLFAFADLDGDNDQDLIISGEIWGDNLTIDLYFNDGNGDFDQATGSSPFTAVILGSIAISDVDNDGDQDILITGESEQSFFTANLYLNDGLGNFTKQLNTPFTGVRYSSIAFADVDNDNDVDVLIIGAGCCENLYLNDGLGNFAIAPDNPFPRVSQGSVGFSDIDGDGDQDVLITGYDTQQNSVTKLFLNDGLANFTESNNHIFKGVYRSAVVFVDVNGDNDQDVLITGKNNTAGPITEFHENDGSGNFTRFGNPFTAVSSSAIAFADIDGDNDQDVFVSGLNSYEVATSKMYINNGQGTYLEMTGTPMIGIKDGSVAFADIDNDNDQDLLISGNRLNNNLYVGASRMYLNDGLGNFTEMTGTPFQNVGNSTIAFADIDGDSDQDVLITGSTGTGFQTSKLYVNDGAGNFTAVANTPFIGVHSGSSLFADVDGDNDQDLIINGRGQTNFENLFTILYRNDGLGNFTEDEDEFFVDTYNSSLAFADMDSDQDLDLLVTGSSLADAFSTQGRIYFNQEEGFVTEPEKEITAVVRSSIAVSDVDGDSDLDVFVTGIQKLGAPGNFTYQNISELHLNDGNGRLNLVPESTFEAVREGSVAFSDVDGDGDEDLIITGENDSLEPTTKLYFNVGNPSISGYCYYDVNENQLRDTSEPTLQNQIIHNSPNSIFNYPVFDGKYRFFVDNGFYQIAAIPAENWRLTTDSIRNVDFTGTSVSDLNFGFVPTAIISLLESDITSGPTRCSFDVPFWLNYQNTGTSIENGYFEFSLTDNATIRSVEPTPDTIIADKLYWNFSNLPPTDRQDFFMILNMPDASQIGDTLHFTATSHLIDDNQDTTQNTVYHYNPVLNCAYDPNDKSAFPAGVGDDNLTLFDSNFEYRIRFQNTGTDTAFTVRIEDDLDPNLDWSTFRPVSASHPYEVDMDLTSGRVTFLFRNILLPDSLVNEPLSHGFVKYKISPLENLSEETPITNEASIFFDFNEPILTNMTLNTMVSMLTNTTEPLYSTELTVIPNPFQKTTIFRIKEISENRGTLNIYDTNGVLVFSESVTSNSDVTFRKEGLASGVYFYEVVDQKSERIFRGKVIKY